MHYDMLFSDERTGKFSGEGTKPDELQTPFPLLRQPENEIAHECNLHKNPGCAYVALWAWALAGFLPGVGKLKGLGTKVPQRGLGMEPPVGSVDKAPIQKPTTGCENNA